MRELDIRRVQRGRKQFTTRTDKNAARPPDLVKREFTATAPHELWLADITYCSTWDGWLSVAFILDVYARTIVGWQIATHMRTDLVIDALGMAAWRRDPAGCAHNADAGSQTVQYTSLHNTDRLDGVPCVYEGHDVHATLCHRLQFGWASRAGRSDEEQSPDRVNQL